MLVLVLLLLVLLVLLLVLLLLVLLALHVLLVLLQLVLLVLILVCRRTWTTQSRTIRASSATPLGPYVREAVQFPGATKSMWPRTRLPGATPRTSLACQRARARRHRARLAQTAAHQRAASKRWPHRGRLRSRRRRTSASR